METFVPRGFPLRRTALFILPIRDGNSTSLLKAITAFSSFHTSYKGWKQFNFRFSIFYPYLFILPIRDGNAGDENLAQDTRVLFILPIRDGNSKHARKQNDTGVLFILPIRDGNPILYGVI